MAFGTTPQILKSHIEDNWQASRVGRGDVPPIVQEGTGNDGVLVVRDRQDARYKPSIHDLIHVYAPEGTGIDTTDTGFKEQDLTETVQIDLSCTDRTDHATGERLVARERMVGDRDALANPEEPPYPGILGETILLLEEIRRGVDEFERVSYDVIQVSLKNSNADVAISVELEDMASNTVL